jgi:MFS family permease
MEKTIDIVRHHNQTRVPKVPQEPVHAKSLSLLVLSGVATIVLSLVTIMLATVLLPMHIASMTQSHQASLFVLIIGIGAVAAVLTNLLVGILSDRIPSPLGRRRLWLIASGILTMSMLLLLAMACSLLMVMIEWIFLQIGINFMQVMLSLMLADQIPTRQRAIMSAFATGLGTLLGGLFGHILVTAFFKTIPTAYRAIAVTIALMMAVFVLFFCDEPFHKEQVPPFHSAASWFNPATHQAAAFTWLAYFLLFVGSITVVNGLFFFLEDVVHSPLLFPVRTIEEEVRTVFAVNILFVLVTSLFAGLLSHKLQCYKGFVMVSSLIMMAGLVVYACFPVWSMVMIATVMLGISMGLLFSVDLALACQLVPTATDRGKDSGLINMAIFLSMILSPIIGAITLGTIHRYLILFSSLAMAPVIAAVLIFPLKCDLARTCLPDDLSTS